MTLLGNLGVWSQPRGLGNFDIGSRTSVYIRSSGRQAGYCLELLIWPVMEERVMDASFIRPVLGILCSVKSLPKGHGN